MKVLVTGADGQLGKDITIQYRDTGNEVFPLGSSDLDITSYQGVSATIKEIQPDLIINCAAYNDVDRAEADWEQAFRVNGLGPKYLALASSKHAACLVHYSTDYIFNGRQTRPYTIADRPDPINRYGESKLLGEQMVERHASEFYLIRTSWVFGSGTTNFVKKVLDWSCEKDSLTIVDDQVSTPTYTKDLARATLTLTTAGEPGVFHVTNSGCCSRFEWAAEILKEIGWKGIVIPGKSKNFITPAKRPAYSVLDNFGTTEVIGYRLSSWQDGTMRFLENRER